MRHTKIYYNNILFIILSMTILMFEAKSQMHLDNFVVLNQADLYGDSIPFNNPDVLNWEHKKNSLFDLSNDLNKYFECLTHDFNFTNERFYVDTIVKVQIKNDTFYLKAYWDSLPQGLWILKDNLGQRRNEYFLCNGKLVFSNFYNEDGDLVREFSKSIGELKNVDKWFYKGKLVRVTYKVNNKYETYIYYPSGNTLVKYLYDEKGKLKEGIYVNEKEQVSTFIRPTKMGW